MQAATTNSNQHLHQRVALFFKSFRRRLPTFLPALMICLVAGTTVAKTTSRQTNTAAKSDAQKAFEKMKTLAGSWHGTIMGISIDVTIRVASSGTAILHEANTDGGGPPNHEITMFYVEGDRLLATHYCDGGNRARLDGKLSPDGNGFEFTFLDVMGGTQGGLVKRMAFTLIDANKHVVEFTFMMPNSKAMELKGEFQRTK
jgi:hypothetical protein